MRRIDHNHIDAGSHELFNPFVRIGAHAHGRAHPQLTKAVFAGHRMFGVFNNVLDCRQTTQLKLVIDNQHPLQAVLVHQ